MARRLWRQVFVACWALGCCGEWHQLNFVAELVELIDGVAAGATFVGSLEMILTQVFEYGSVGEHVPDRGDDRMLDRDEGPHGTSPGGESLISGLEVCSICSDGCHGRDAQRSLEVRVAWPGVTGFHFPRGLVVAGANTGPGGQLRGCGELGHVTAGFSDDDLGDRFTDTGDGAE